MVADADMVHYHGAEAAQRFLLTVMNMVSVPPSPGTPVPALGSCLGQGVLGEPLPQLHFGVPGSFWLTFAFFHFINF